MEILIAILYFFVVSIFIFLFIFLIKKRNMTGFLPILLAVLVTVSMIRISQGYNRSSILLDTIISNANK